MRYVFISYSSHEIGEARKVREHLEKNGVRCWMAPRDIPAGSNYTKEIPIAIRECAVFVLLLSQKAQDSHWVLKELDNAVNCKKTLLPFMLEDCSLREEFAFLLTGCQRFFAFSRYNEALDLLLERVRQFIPSQQPVTAPQPEPGFAPEPEFTPPVKESPVGGLHCPACGSHRVIHMPKRLVTCGFAEKLHLLLYVPFAILFGIAGGLLMALITCWGSEELIIFSSFFGGGPLGIVAGILLGKKYIAEQLRRRRIRHHIDVRKYRCQTCMKYFTKVFPSEFE